MPSRHPMRMRSAQPALRRLIPVNGSTPRDVHTPWTLGEQSPRIDVPTGTTARRHSACNAGDQLICLHSREWCPVSLVVPLCRGTRDGQKH